MNITQHRWLSAGLGRAGVNISGSLPSDSHRAGVGTVDPACCALPAPARGTGVDSVTTPITINPSGYCYFVATPTLEVLVPPFSL